MTTTEALIAHYGLFAVFIGGLLEGETFLILAAVAAHQGILSLPLVFVFGAIGATIGDQTWFLLSRYKRDMPLVRKLVAKPEVRKAIGLIQRYPTVFILSLRFLYGLRTAGAVACGLSEIPTPRFMVVNVIAAVIWTAVMLALGYAFGSAIEAVLGNVDRVEMKILLAAIVVVIAAVAIRFAAARWQRRAPRPADQSEDADK